jgi:hypothetical protein
MLTYIDVEYGANGALRRYQHPTLGVIEVLSMYGRNGSADIVNLHGALEIARGLQRFEAWEREEQQRERRRRPRKRESRCRIAVGLDPALPQPVANPPLPARPRPPRSPGPTKPAA